MGKTDGCLVRISLWDMFKIHFYSFVYGLLVSVKMLVKWIWDPNSFFVLQQRDNPPACLVDSFLGQHKYVKLKGVKFHYVEAGSKTLPLLLLLHGFPDCWLSWRHQIPTLSKHFRVIALDLKGFGDSDKPSKRNTYRIDTILEELHQLILALGVQSCTILGHDIGALLGWCMAHQYPEMVAKLVVVSCPHPNIYRTSLHTSSNYHWMNFVQLPFLPEFDALREDVKIISEYHRHLPANDTYLEAYKYSFCRKEDWSGAMNYFRNFLYVEISERSHTIRVPVVLIVGDKDKMVKLKSIIKSTEFCERFHVKLIDDCGHFPHQEHPEEFNATVLKYLVNQEISRERSKVTGLVDRMFGAVSTTVKYGNSVIDSVQKNVGNMPNLSILSGIYDKTENG